jgi:hypothetical protein
MSSALDGRVFYQLRGRQASTRDPTYNTITRLYFDLSWLPHLLILDAQPVHRACAKASAALPTRIMSVGSHILIR